MCSDLIPRITCPLPRLVTSIFLYYNVYYSNGKPQEALSKSVGMLLPYILSAYLLLGIVWKWARTSERRLDITRFHGYPSYVTMVTYHRDVSIVTHHTLLLLHITRYHGYPSHIIIVTYHTLTWLPITRYQWLAITRFHGYELWFDLTTDTIMR